MTAAARPRALKVTEPFWAEREQRWLGVRRYQTGARLYWGRSEREARRAMGLRGGQRTLGPPID